MRCASSWARDISLSLAQHLLDLLVLELKADALQQTEKKFKEDYSVGGVGFGADRRGT